MVQSAFHYPVTPLELLEREHPHGLQFFQRQTAYQINHFTVPLAVSLDPRFQASHRSGSRKTRLAGLNLQALQKANLQSAPVVLAREHPSPRRGPRGKNPVLQT